MTVPREPSTCAPRRVPDNEAEERTLTGPFATSTRSLILNLVEVGRLVVTETGEDCHDTFLAAS